jgi:hypothetical protein
VNPFRRSAWFGVIGVVVVAVVVAVIALNVDQTDAQPKEALGLIFTVIGAYLVLLFVFQSRDLSRAEAADARASTVAPAEIENPATLDEPTLWAALATKPIGEDAIRARKQVWSTTRSSMRLGMLISALIFLSVPPIYLLDTFVPILIGAPLIAGIALWKSARLLASGGDLDTMYENADVALAPLGLAITERPSVVIEPKGVAPFRMGAGVHGQLLMEGRRHDRHVVVRMPADEGARSKAEVRLAAPVPEFEFRARDGRLMAADGAPAAAAVLLKGVPNSPRWNGLKGAAGAEGIAIEHKGAGQADWLMDLWLAERLADALK